MLETVVLLFNNPIWKSAAETCLTSKGTVAVFWSL